jgi:3-hydroxy acid dehydrogenase / malonic semialdehyde reductase
MSKTVMITGATSGFGHAAAEIFAQNGYRIIIIGRREKILNSFTLELKNKFEAKVLPLVLDVRDRQKVQESLNSLPGDWQDIDILVNNAGLASGLSPIHEGDIDDWERMIDTNVKGLLYVSRAITPGMVARRRGHIINIGSVAGKETYLDGNVYCASKYAVDSLTKAMRMDLVKYGIRVSQIAPGAAETEFAIVRFHGDKEAASKVYKGYQPLSAYDVASVIYYVASLPEHVCINDLVIMPTAQANTVHWKKDPL